MRNVSNIVDRSMGSIHCHAAGLRSRNCRRNCSEYVRQLIRMDAKPTGRDMSKRSLCEAQHNHRMHGSRGGQQMLESTSNAGGLKLSERESSDSVMKIVAIPKCPRCKSAFILHSTQLKPSWRDLMDSAYCPAWNKASSSSG